MGKANLHALLLNYRKYKDPQKLITSGHLILIDECSFLGCLRYVFGALYLPFYKLSKQLYSTQEAGVCFFLKKKNQQ